MTESLSVLTWLGEWRELKEGVTKGHGETFEGDGHVHYLNYGSGFAGIYTYDKTHQITYLKHAVYYMSILSQ